MRLDKLISNATVFTRSQAQKVIKKGKVTVDGQTIKKPAQHVNEGAHVEYMGVAISKPLLRYIVLHKPVGVVCANKDKQHPTVFDNLFLPRIDTLHVAGRLDIDTTGLVLITDDGQWLHRVTSPRHQHVKTYLIELDTPVTDKQIQQLKTGVKLKEEKTNTLPAKVEKLTETKIRLGISEGKYHQVKRMLAAVGNHVLELHREQIGNIVLGSDLAVGQWRELSPEEINSFE